MTQSFTMTKSYLHRWWLLLVPCRMFGGRGMVLSVVRCAELSNDATERTARAEGK